MRDRFTAITAILLLLVLICTSYWYSVKAQREVVTHLSDLQKPDFIAENTTITKFGADGVADAKVFASLVEHFSDGHATVSNPRYYSMDPKSAQITAKSDSAKMVSGGEVVHFYDNVELKQAASGNKPESRLETSQIDAYPDTNEYKSDKPVKLVHGKDVSTGVGMDYDNVEHTFRLRSRVQTTIQPSTLRNNQ